MSNVLLKMVHDFWLYHATFGEFQVFKTNFRLMAKCSNGIKPNLSLHNMKNTLSLVPYLKHINVTMVI